MWVVLLFVVCWNAVNDCTKTISKYLFMFQKCLKWSISYYLFSSYSPYSFLLHPSSFRPNFSIFSATSSPSAFDHLSLLSPSHLSPPPTPPSQGWVSVRMIYYPAPFFSPFLSHWITEHSQRRQLRSLAFHSSHHRHWLVHGTHPAKDTQWQCDACKTLTRLYDMKRAMMQT